jgi:hypothetical protein
MRTSLRLVSVIAACILVGSLGACASAPDIDGGIVGTGNRIDCEALAKQERNEAPVPEQCRRESAGTR